LFNILDVKEKSKVISGVILSFLFLFSIFFVFSSELKRNGYKKVFDFLGIPEIIQYAEIGKKDLVEAKNFTLNFDFENSALKISSAKENFTKAQNKLNRIDLIYSRFIPFLPTNTISKILKASLNSVDILSYTNHILWTFTSEYDLGKVVVSLSNILDILDELEKNTMNLNLFVLPEDIQNKIKEITLFLDDILVYRQFLYKNIDTLYSMLGMDEAKTYMLVLQNTAEARATGGYIGSVVLFTMQNGKLFNFEFLDTHLLDFKGGRFSPAPEYLYYIERIALQEANYTPDIRVSGQRMKYFLENQGGPTVDTIIFIDDQILPFILDLTGSINVDGFDQAIDKENYFNLLQLNIEENNLKGEKRIKNPKENYFQFIEAVRQKLFDIKFNISYINKLKDFIYQKHIQVFSDNIKIEEFFDDLNFNGYFPNSIDNQDFLAIIHSTFFNKSNRFMEDEILHDTNISKNGEIINTLKIIRKHTYNEEKEKKIIEDVWDTIVYQSDVFREDFLKLVGKSKNLDLLRIYIPKDSEILSLEGISDEDIYIGEELDRTFLAFPFEIDISETREFSIEYKLPFKLNNILDYNLFIFKQAGSEDFNIIKKIFYQKENSVEFKKEEKLTNDLLFFIKVNNLLWNKKIQLMTNKSNKLQSKLKMKTVQEFMPMQLL
jgi:uncharacterized UPF0146 family protein/DNA-dependent RNA polymerase auxiliary subunit epsilon